MTNIKVLRTTDSSFEDNFKSVLIRIKGLSADVESVVKTIIKDIKIKGDQALFSYTEKYDGVRLHSSGQGGIRVRRPGIFAERL